MKKIITVFMIGLISPFTASVAKTPCWGESGGISHCEGTKFVCNNGKYSGTKKICSGYNKKKHTENKAPHKKTINADSKTVKKTEITKLGNLLKLDYQGFTLWIDCAKRGAVKFQYKVQQGTGNKPGVKQDFMLDPSVPKECQQTSTAAYGRGYDRGRLVPAEHLHASPEAIQQSNYMTNILPQALQMKRGAWLLTDEIIKCYRDVDELSVIGGVIWGDKPADDYFVKSHKVKTPDAFWKVVIRGAAGQDEQAIAWVVPNSKNATQKHLNNYLISLGELEIITGEKIPVANYLKSEKPSASWTIPDGCKKG